MSKQRAFLLFSARAALVLSLALLLLAAYGYRWERQQQAAFQAQAFDPPGEMVPVGEHLLHAVVKGSGEPGVLFISGLGDGATTWRRVQSDLSEHTRTVSYDRPGLGWSPPIDSDTTLDSAADDVVALVTDADLFERPPILVGHSLGGALARHVAYRFPGAVAGLVLVDPTPLEALEAAPPSFRRVTGVLMRWQQVRSELGWLRREVHRNNRQASEERLLAWGQIYGSAELMRQVRRELRGFSSSTPVTGGHGELGDLPLTVVAAPAQGPPFFGRALEAIQSAKTGMSSESRVGRLIEVDTGHYVQFDDPDTVVAAVLGMIASLDSKTRGGGRLPKVDGGSEVEQ